MAISTQLIVALMISIVFIFFTTEYRVWELILMLLLLIPSTAQGLISGVAYSTPGILNLSMVGYVTIISGIILTFRYKTIERKTTFYLSICFVVLLLVRVLADGADFVSNKLLDNYFLPMLLSILIVSYLKTEYIPRLLKFLYICILIGAIIACVEYVYGKSLLFHEYYMNTCPWYEKIYVSSQYVSFRSCSIFGHPLIGAIYYLLALVYLFNMGNKNKFKFTIQFILLVLAILSTNSRSALLGLALYSIWFLIKNKKIGKLLALSIIIVILMFIVDWKTFYYSLFARDNSGSSFMVRVKAVLSLMNIPIRSFILGEGYNNTSSLLQNLGFTGNVEISYLIILMENGVIGFGAWVASILHFFRKKMNSDSINSVYVSIVSGMLICLFIVGGMSNSFGDPGTLNYTIYILAAFYYLLNKRTIEKKIYNKCKFKISFCDGSSKIKSIKKEF